MMSLFHTSATLNSILRCSIRGSLTYKPNYDYCYYKGRVLQQDKNRKINKNIPQPHTKSDLISKQWEGGTIGDAQTPPFSVRSTHTQQSGPQDCKRQPSPNPPHHQTKRPFPMGSQKIAHPIKEEFSLLSKQAINRHTKRSKACFTIQAGL